MRKNLLAILAIFVGFAAQAQTKISGRVKDNRNLPLRGISITIKDSYDGATTDSLGYFSFTTDEKGEKVIEATALNYRPFTKTIMLDGKDQVVDIVLKEKINEETAVTVTAGSFEASDRKRTTVLNPIDIVTTASANGDITSALKTLPGTQSVGESEGLFVRGGTATESKIFIDGTLVNNFFYSSTPGIATRGRFNPFLFKGTVFSAGGYSALYGQALSSALILESIDLPDQSSADIGISYLFAGAGFQKLDKKKKYSFGANLNFTDLSLAFAIIKQRQDYFRTPRFWEGDANFRIKTSATGMVKYYGYFSNGKIGFRSADIDSNGLKNAFNINNFNMYHNLSWREKIGKGWKMNAGISFSTNKDDIANELQDANNVKQTISTPSYMLFKNNGLNNRAAYLQTKLVLEKRLPGINALRFGMENSYSNEKAAFTIYNGNVFRDTVKENILAGFAETDIYITNFLAAKVGGRVEHSKILDAVNAAPRISLAYKFRRQAQLSFAYGIFYQNPERRYLPTPFEVDFSKASHYILQYQRVSKDYTLRGEVFYKDYNNLYKTATVGGREVVQNALGKGYAKGIELFWRDRKTIKNLDYWFSYSFLDTKREFLNYPSLLEPSFAAKHTASLVLKKFVTTWKTGFNASYTFATGRPYYNLRYDNVQQKYEVAEQGRTINYNNLSFSMNYLPNLGKPTSKTFMVLVASVNNVLGNNQVFNYNFSTDGTRKQAILPASRRFFFIGAFISIGVDRTQDAINNNL
jgi:vitamin B12 transporter